MLERHRGIETGDTDDSDADTFAVLALLVIIFLASAYYLNS